MSNPKVSIVIPVYNTEPYVAQTVRSIVGQTLRDIEIIAIDDGSTDSSGDILRQLAAEDERIRVYAQPNRGLSETRNAGLDCARGRYVYFMDSDDLLEADALELCFERAEAERLDFVFFDAECFGAASAGSWHDYRRVRHVGEQPAPGRELLRQMLDRDCYRASACLSFIRTDYLRRLGLRFHPGILHEDELFTPQLYLAAERCAGIDRAFFRRRLREGSIMGTDFSQRNIRGYTTVLRELHRVAVRHDAATRQIVRRLTSRILNATLTNASTQPWGVRLRLTATALCRYPRCVHPRALAALLLKTPLKKLSRQ